MVELLKGEKDVATRRLSELEKELRDVTSSGSVAEER